MSTQDDITSAIRRVDWIREHPPQGDLIFHAPGTLRDEPAPVELPLAFANVEDLRRFVRAEVRKELDAIAQEFREHPALRPFPMAGEE